MAEYELLLEATADSPWSSLKPHVYRAISTCHVKAGNLNKAIRRLEACTYEFPREAKVHFELAALQAQATDFAGAAETIRRATDANPEMDSDWRLSTMLALREIINDPDRMVLEEQLQKLRGSHPAVWHLIERTCIAYWPVFNQLFDIAKNKWTGAILHGYYFVVHEETARPLLEQTAINLFAMAVEIELRSRVFAVFKEEFLKDIRLRQAARVPSRGAEKFRRYLIDNGKLGLGEMGHILKMCEGADTGILAEYRAWLMKCQPKLTDVSGHLSVIVGDRNRATHPDTHEGLDNAVGIDEIHRLCQAVIGSLHGI
jgi:tetratricopeptide (TPR) repeat protein